MKKIAIYGGAFNPIHNGHINLALSLNKIYGFDRIILIPTGNPVHKSDSDFASNDDRMNMCILAAKTNPIFTVSDIEIKSNEKSYTYNTLQKLKKIYTDAELYLIIGGDMLMIFDKWYKYKELAQEARIVCAAREENLDVLKNKQRYLQTIGCTVDLVDIPIIEISSSQIREKLKFNQTVNELLPDGVLEYIIERNVYEKLLQE